MPDTWPAKSLGTTALSAYAACVSTRATQVVMGGCHSLMEVDGVLHGDPLEASALEGIRWKWDAVSHTARPDDGKTVVALESDGNGKGGSADNDDREKPTGSGNKKTEDKPGAKAEKKKKGGRRKTKPRGGGGSGKADSDERGAEKASGDGVSVEVWRRYAFSSQLQRMSVVAKVCGGSAALTDKEGVPEVSGGGQRQRRVSAIQGENAAAGRPARLPLPARCQRFLISTSETTCNTRTYVRHNVRNISMSAAP